MSTLRLLRDLRRPKRAHGLPIGKSNLLRRRLQWGIVHDARMLHRISRIDALQPLDRHEPGTGSLEPPGCICGPDFHEIFGDFLTALGAHAETEVRLAHDLDEQAALRRAVTAAHLGQVPGTAEFFLVRPRGLVDFRTRQHRVSCRAALSTQYGHIAWPIAGPSGTSGPRCHPAAPGAALPARADRYSH